MCDGPHGLSILNCSGMQLNDGPISIGLNVTKIALGVRILSPQPTGDLLVNWCPAVPFLLHDTGALTIPPSELLLLFPLSRMVKRH